MRSKVGSDAPKSSEDLLKGTPSMPGGLLTSKPTWPNTSGCLATSALFDFWAVRKFIMIKILIADDHPVVRRGVKQIVSEQSDMQVLGEAQNVQAVFQLLRQRQN
jgi:hypothetical protein